MWFIFDTNGQPVGNPKGYKTNRGAATQARSPKSPVYREIYRRYNQDEENRQMLIAAGLSHLINNHLYSIKCRPDPEEI